MNVIQDFESKLKIIGGEKVYSAREIMKTFGYDKWERFVGAINRAKAEIEDDKKRDENFMFIVNKSTGGRPREDVMLTLGACYLVLKKCDGRKENVQKLLEYLQGLVQEKKIQSRTFTPRMSYERGFILVIAFFFFVSLFYYLGTYIYYLTFHTNDFDFQKVVQKELPIEIKKQEEVLKDYDEKIHSGAEIHPEIVTQVNMDFDFQASLKNYIDAEQQDYFHIQKGFNERTQFLKNITGENLIKAYFLLGNVEKIKDSCSLLSPKNCFAATKGSLKSFANFWDKTKDGYEVLEVRKAKSFPDKNIYCVMYKYKLKYDTSGNDIVETYNYTTQTKNGIEQIDKRFCESIEKNGRKISCPFQLKTYYCK